jgi:hypothetical protein
LVPSVAVANCVIGMVDPLIPLLNALPLPSGTQPEPLYCST